MPGAKDFFGKYLVDPFMAGDVYNEDTHQY